MSESFVKLFSTITESTVWFEPDPVRILWITLLAMADRSGKVYGSVPGLAHRARISTEDCLTGINKFMEPDEHSRTPDNDGRRLEKIEGGWRILNYGYYRQKRSKAERAQYQAEWIKSKRNSCRHDVDTSVESRPESTAVDPIAEAEADKRKPPTGVKEKSPRGTRLPPDWSPDEDLLAWAKSERPDLDLPKVLADFRDYWVAKSEKATKLDWPATFRSWVRKERNHIKATGKAPVTLVNGVRSDWL